jgi:hypothetical protein
MESYVLWDLWWTKWYWGAFSLNTSVSSTNYRYTNGITFINRLEKCRLLGCGAV